MSKTRMVGQPWVDVLRELPPHGQFVLVKMFSASGSMYAIAKNDRRVGWMDQSDSVPSKEWSILLWTPIPESDNPDMP